MRTLNLVVVLLSSFVFASLLHVLPASAAIVDRVKALCQAEHPDKVKMQFVCFKLELAALQKITAKSQTWPKGSPQQEIAVRCLHEAITVGNQVKYTQAVSCIEEKVGP